MNIEDKIKQLTIVEAKEDDAYAGSKVYVTVEMPATDPAAKFSDLDDFFRTDAVKRVVTKEASKITNRPTGWSDISRMHFYKDGVEVHHREAANAVRVRYTCLATP